MQHNTRACTLKRVDITEADLPLSCPMPGKRLWDAHPKVYLPIPKNTEGNSDHAICPYCDTAYFLTKQTDLHDN